MEHQNFNKSKRRSLIFRFRKKKKRCSGKRFISKNHASILFMQQLRIPRINVLT